MGLGWGRGGKLKNPPLLNVRVTLQTLQGPDNADTVWLRLWDRGCNRWSAVKIVECIKPTIISSWLDGKQWKWKMSVTVQHPSSPSLLLHSPRRLRRVWCKQALPELQAAKSCQLHGRRRQLCRHSGTLQACVCRNSLFAHDCISLSWPQMESSGRAACVSCLIWFQ